MDGVVKSTAMFKELIGGNVHELDVLEDTALPPFNKPLNTALQFGPLLVYQETQLVTWHDTALFVMDPGLATFAGYHLCLGPIKGVGVCEDEIFILRDNKERPIVRIAQKPDLKLSPGKSQIVPYVRPHTSLHNTRLQNIIPKY